MDDETFEFYAPLKMKDNPLWINVTELMQIGAGEAIKRLVSIPALQPNLTTYINRLNSVDTIKEIDLHIEEVTGEDKTVDIVVDIFNLVNSGGTKLSKGDLALAKICAMWPQAREEMKNRLDKWRRAGFEFRLEWLLRNINTILTGEALFAALKDIDTASFQKGLQKAEKAVDYLIDLIASRLGMDHDRVLGSRYSFPLLARYLMQRGVRWEGTERKHGAELNISKRMSLIHPLAVLIEKAYEAIQPFIRERQYLHDLFFTERLEYPTFVWQEAIVNAVAHRDYSIRGASIEFWMFDDRMEIRSPGLPPHPVTVAALNQRKHLHISRNPLMVRVLADLGYMRELGEGIPRMFEEMERQGFYPPLFEDIGGVSFQVKLRNQPVYDRATLEWLQRFAQVPLDGDQKRLLAFAQAHGNHFTSRDFQKLAGVDIYGASTSIKDLIKKGVVRSIKKGSRTYEVIEPQRALPELPSELLKILPIMRKEGRIANIDVRQALGEKVSRNTVWRLLRNWVEMGWLIGSGEKRGRAYEPGERLMQHL